MQSTARLSQRLEFGARSDTMMGVEDGVEDGRLGGRGDVETGASESDRTRSRHAVLALL